MARTGRPPTCTCEECPKCIRRIKAREKYRSLSLAEKRALIARRDPETVRANDRRRHERDRAKRLAAMRDYASENRDKFTAANRRWVERNPEKAAAHTAVGNALRDGHLTREPCEVCGTDLRVQAHHDDYSKPLEVRWLCTTHHAEHHKHERAAMREAS